MGLSTTYTKTETDYLLQKLESELVSGLKGELAITDTAPTIQGLYILSDVGTYTNLGGLVASADKLNYAYFNGTTWSFIATDLPQPIVNNYINNNTYNLDPDKIVPSEALYNDETLAGDILKRVEKISGDNVNYREVLTWFDGSLMDDSKIDNFIYIKKNNKYYKLSKEYYTAWDFGFRPNSTKTQNQNAIKNALLFGEKELNITVKGSYNWGNEQIAIPSEVSIKFCEGSYINLTEDTHNIFYNAGAITRTWNYGIKLLGLKIKTNGYNSGFGQDNPLYGLHGYVNFFYVKNCEFEIEITDLSGNNFGFQICVFKDCIIRKAIFEGLKDGLHLGNGDGLLVEYLKAKTKDDALALNAFDWAVSNPEIGDIKNVTVRNFTSRWDMAWGNASRSINALVGTPTAWISGMEIVNGDAVCVDGKTYRAILNDNTQTKTSTTKPTISSYTGVQSTSEGIIWKFIKNEEIKTANIINCNIENYHHYDGYDNDNSGNSSHTFLNMWSGKDQVGSNIISRALHPNVPIKDYPTVDISFKNMYVGLGFVAHHPYIGYNLSMNNLRGKKGGSQLFYTEYSPLKKSFLSISNCNFNGMSPNGLNVKGNVDISILGCHYTDNEFLEGNYTGSRLVTDLPLGINENSLTPRNGDILNVYNRRKLFKEVYGIGNQWVNL